MGMLTFIIHISLDNNLAAAYSGENIVTKDIRPIFMGNNILLWQMNIHVLKVLSIQRQVISAQEVCTCGLKESKSHRLVLFECKKKIFDPEKQKKNYILFHHHGL